MERFWRRRSSSDIFIPRYVGTGNGGEFFEVKTGLHSQTSSHPEGYLSNNALHARYDQSPCHDKHIQVYERIHFHSISQSRGSIRLQTSVIAYETMINLVIGLELPNSRSSKFSPRVDADANLARVRDYFGYDDKERW